MDNTQTRDEEFLCPRCQTVLPKQRQSAPWCECGWNLPADPVEQLQGWERAWGRVNRWFGKLQARRDARWLSRDAPQRRLGWRLLTVFIYLLAPLFAIVKVGLYLLPISCVIWAISIWHRSRILALLMLFAVALAAVPWSLSKLKWLLDQIRHKARPPAYEPPQHLSPATYSQVLKAARGVAERLDVVPPDMVILSLWPVIGPVRHIQWAFPPRIERGLVVGLPVLAVLNVSEFKALVGHILTFFNGPRIWLLPAIERVLDWCWATAIRLMEGSARAVFFALALGIPILSCISLCFLTSGETQLSTTTWTKSFRTIGLIVAPFFFIALVASVILWLAALWYRRQTLLADRAVAQAYGRNVLLRALPKLWVAGRSFSRHWRAMAQEAQRTPEQANLYAQFEKRWTNLPDPLKEKAFREVTVEFRSLLYFKPVLQDRAMLLAPLPNKLFDDRPATRLLPQITQIGAAITQDLKGL